MCRILKCLRVENRLDLSFLALTRYSHPCTGHSIESMGFVGMLVLYNDETPTGVMACSAATLSRTGVGGWNVRLASLHLADNWCLFKDGLPSTVSPHFRQWTFIFRRWSYVGRSGASQPFFDVLRRNEWSWYPLQKVCEAEEAPHLCTIPWWPQRNELGLPSPPQQLVPSYQFAMIVGRSFSESTRPPFTCGTLLSEMREWRVLWWGLTWTRMWRSKKEKDWTRRRRVGRWV